MIGYISGKVLEHLGKKILIYTDSGVGYEVNFGFKAEVGKKLDLYIHHHITDSDQSLWGFKTREEKKIFELLKTVNKVGASKAYPLVSVVGIENVLMAIRTQDASVLTDAPGIGKKMAEQIILSLKDKIDNLGDLSIAQVLPTQSGASNKVDEVLLALNSLGYDNNIVYKTVLDVAKQDGLNTEDMIKQVLQKL